MGSSIKGGAGGVFGDSKLGNFFADIVDPQKGINFAADRAGVSRSNGLVAAGNFGSLDRWSRDIGGAANAASNAKTKETLATNAQAAQAADIKNTLLTQPKNITPDNFLANKASQLAGLRLGLAGTISSGGAPGATLGSTSLTGNYPGKPKLGQ